MISKKSGILTIESILRTLLQKYRREPFVSQNSHFIKKLTSVMLATSIAMSATIIPMAAPLESDASQTQTSSAPETIYVNSYSGNQRSILFDNHWRFYLGDADNAQTPTFNDSAWTDIQLSLIHI